MYLTEYSSPLGSIFLASDGTALVGLWMEGQKYFAATLGADVTKNAELPVFRQIMDWLDAYFEKRPLPALPPLAPKGSDFRQAVWKLLLQIPYGEVTTYGELAHALQAQGVSAAAQAVGGAVGHNPISIIIPCHRVVGADGSLTGYAGGVDKKRFLLTLEGVGYAKIVYAEERDCPVIYDIRSLIKNTPPVIRRCVFLIHWRRAVFEAAFLPQYPP